MAHSHILSEIDQHLDRSRRRMLDSRGSLAASLFSRDSDYDLRESTPGLNAPSYRSSPMRSEYVTESEGESDSPWSPPGWRKSASGLYSTRGYTVSPSWSRGPSPMFQNAEEFNEVELARRIPLPDPRDTPYETPQPHPELRHVRLSSADPKPVSGYTMENDTLNADSGMPRRGCKLALCFLLLFRKPSF